MTTISTHFVRSPAMTDISSAEAYPIMPRSPIIAPRHCPSSFKAKIVFQSISKDWFDADKPEWFDSDVASKMWFDKDISTRMWFDKPLPQCCQE